MQSTRERQWGFLLFTQVFMGGVLLVGTNNCELQVKPLEDAGPPDAASGAGGGGVGGGGAGGGQAGVGGVGGGGAGGGPVSPAPIPTEMVWYHDQTVCRDPNGFGGYRNQYPSVVLQRLVARDDESAFGTGSYSLPSEGLGSLYGEYQGNGEINREGPHTFKIDIATGGASASWSTLDDSYRSIEPLKACGSGPWRGRGLIGPYIEPAGGDIAFYRQNGDTYQCADTYTYTCKFGELSKFAAPQWSLGTTEMCAHKDFAFGGDAMGNVATCADASLKKYDPSGVVSLDVVKPFGFIAEAISLTATGDIHAAGISSADVYIARTDASGSLLWTKSFPNTIPAYKEKKMELAVDDSGSSIVAFYAYSMVDLGGGPLQPIGLRDVVFAKFDPSGNLLWAKRLGGFEILRSTMRKTGADTIVLAVHFDVVLDLGGTYHQSSPVLLRYDTNGNLTSLNDLLPLYPSPAPEVLSFAIAGHSSGAVFVAGSGYGAASSMPTPNCDLGPSPLLPGTHPRPLRTFLAKYGP